MNLLRILGFGQRKVETIGLEVPAWKREHPEWPFDRAEAGRKARETNLKKFGLNYYSRIGVAGGRKARGGGFTGNPERARLIGKLGGEAAARKRRAA